MTTPVKDHPGTRLKRPDESLFKRLTRQQLFIPIVALVLLVLFNLIADPSFFAISIKENSLGNPVLSGNIISVLDNASELVMLAIGMTLMTASSGGQDISVGACMAIAGSVILRMACGGQVTADTMQTPLFLAVLVGILVAIRYRPDQGSLKLDRIRSGLPHDIVHTRSFLVRPRDGEIQLRIILERYSLEVFVNDGEQAASAVIYTWQEADAITFEAGGSALMDVEKYDLAFDGQEA